MSIATDVALIYTQFVKVAAGEEPNKKEQVAALEAGSRLMCGLLEDIHAIAVAQASLAKWKK